MAKIKTEYIVIGIAILIGLFYFLPKLNTFSILPSGECNANLAGNFLTNINYDTETINSYYKISDQNIGGWISVDWNGDGQLDIFGNPQIFEGNATQACAGKAIITTTISGLKVVKFGESSVYNTVGICPNSGNAVILFYSNVKPSDAKTNINQCTNFQVAQTQTNVTNVTICSMLAKQCPDGSYVAENSSNYCAFDSCPVLANCTQNKYTICSNNITYKSQQCTNGTLFPVNYLVNPCSQTVSNTSVNCVYTYSSWSTCNNLTSTQTHTVTNSTSTICPNNPTISQSCTVSSSFWSNELYNLNGFSIKMWMLLLAIGLIILLFLLKGK